MRLLFALSTLAYTVAGALSDELLFEDHASVADVSSEAADDVLDAADAADGDAAAPITDATLPPEPLLPPADSEDLAEDHPPMPPSEGGDSDRKDSFVQVRPNTRPPSWKVTPFFCPSPLPLLCPTFAHSPSALCPLLSTHSSLHTLLSTLLPFHQHLVHHFTLFLSAAAAGFRLAT